MIVLASEKKTPRALFGREGLSDCLLVLSVFYRAGNFAKTPGEYQHSENSDTFVCAYSLVDNTSSKRRAWTIMLCSQCSKVGLSKRVLAPKGFLVVHVEIDY